jgi:hypothetical protein
MPNMSMYCRFRLNKAVRGFVFCALACNGMPGFANSMAPPRQLHPTHDVTVTYVRSDGLHVVIKTAKGGYPFRVEYPDQKAFREASRSEFDRGESYAVALSAKGKSIPLGPQIKAQDGMRNGFYIWQDSRKFDYMNRPAEDWIGQMKLVQYNGSDVIAGIACDQWTIKSQVEMTIHGTPITSGRDRVCLSSDGVILRFLRGMEVDNPGSSLVNLGTRYTESYPTSVIAVSVSYEPLPPETFAMPADYTQMEIEPPPAPPPLSP